MHKSTYVCFDCRTTERVPARRITRNCRKCRQRAEHVYCKFKVPAKNDDDGWDALRDKVRWLNKRTQAYWLKELRSRRAKYARILEQAPSKWVERRRNLQRRIAGIDQRISEWLRW